MLNRGGNTVSVINTVTDTVEKTIVVGDTPSWFLFWPDTQKLYVLNSGIVTESATATISVIDLATDSVVDTFALPGISPRRMVFNKDGTKIYVSNFSTTLRWVNVVDVETGTIDKTINTESDFPEAMILSLDGTRLYVACVNDGISSSNIFVVNTSDNEIKKDFSVGHSPRSFAMTPDGLELYVPCVGASATYVIETVGDTVADTIGTPDGFTPPPANSSSWLAQYLPVQGANRVYVSNTRVSVMSVIDTQDKEVVADIDLDGGTPRYFTFTPDFKQIYIASIDSNIVSVIDLDTNAVMKVIDVGESPRCIVAIAIPPNSPTSLQGVQKKNRFLTQTDLVNVLSWQPPIPGPAVWAYKVYRDAALTELAGIVENGRLEFKDRNRKAKEVYTYYVVAEGEYGSVSAPSVVHVLPL